MVDQGMQMHLVLKFRYTSDMIETVMGVQRPQEDYKHEFGTPARIFPYCIFNAVEEVPLSWTYQNDGGNVYERIELNVVLTYVSYYKYFPFVLKLLPIKVGTDGTGDTGLINLIPETLPGGSIPNADLGIFTKSTSEFGVGGADEATIAKKVVCRMLIRDLSDKSIGNIKGIYTRVYVVIFFEADVMVSFVRYIVVPTMIAQLCTFFTMMEIGDLIQTVLAMTLADVALLFTMPANDMMTLAEQVILAQICYFIGMGATVGFLRDHDLLPTQAYMHHEIVFLDLLMALLTMGWVFAGYKWFQRLTKSIREKFDPIVPEHNVAAFRLIEEEI